MIVKYCAKLLSKIYYSLTINIRNMNSDDYRETLF